MESVSHGCLTDFEPDHDPTPPGGVPMRVRGERLAVRCHGLAVAARMLAMVGDRDAQEWVGSVGFGLAATIGACRGDDVPGSDVLLVLADELYGELRAEAAEVLAAAGDPVGAALVLGPNAEGRTSRWTRLLVGFAMESGVLKSDELEALLEALGVPRQTADRWRTAA